MKLEVAVSSRYQWVPRLREEVADGDRIMQSDVHPALVMRHEAVAQESVTTIEVPDESWEQMHADHVTAMTSIGAPVRSKRRILAQHLQTVMAEQAPTDAVQSVHVVSEAGDAGEYAALEAFLMSQLKEDGE